jgi:argininosuccinate lyase
LHHIVVVEKISTPLYGRDVCRALSHGNAVERRNTPGGTGPGAVAAQLEALQAWLGGRSGQGGES